MDERVRPTRSGLFAIELLVAVGIFTLCAAICVGLFVRSEVMSRDSAVLTRAVSEAKSAAECYKAEGGDLARTAALFGGSVQDGALRVSYDKDWNILPESSGGAAYCLELAPLDNELCPECALRLYEPGGETLVDWTVAALEVAS